MPNVKKVLMAAAGAGGIDYGNKKLFVWGANTNGGLGLGNTTDLSSPVQLGATGDWQRASVSGKGHSLFIKPNGTMWSCGSGHTGATGHGNTNDLSSPVQIGSDTDWAWINAARQGDGGGIRPRSAAIKTDGTLWMWGRGLYGALGTGSVANQYTPTQVGSLTTWKKVVLGRDFSVALKTDGTIWSWGRNTGGQLGTSTAPGVNVSSPVQIGALTTWTDIAAGGNAAGGIRSDGKTYCWGNNYYGNLGNNERGGVGGAPNQSSPVLVVGGQTFTSIAMGYNQCVAVQADGTMFSWGRNYRGQCGIGLGPGVAPGSSVSSPVQVGSLTDWAGFGVKDASGNDILGFGATNQTANQTNGQSWTKVKTDGTIWSWATGTAGAIGVGNLTNYSSPVQVGSSTKWLSSYTGYASAWAFEQGS